MKLLSVDVGTTSCKAGLFDTAGTVHRVAHRPTPARTDPAGQPYYDPDELFQTVCAAIREAIDGVPPGQIALVSVASMAETGGLIDRITGAPRSPLIPWFNMQAAPYADLLARQDQSLERFCKFGLYPNAKVSLAKLLWLRERDPAVLHGALWLSAADTIVYRLTGQARTDYSLAGRTYAFRVDRREWDADWLGALGLSSEIFPPAGPSGEPAGQVHGEGHAASGLPIGVPVAVAGHDHVCGALGAGAVTPGTVFNSMGTAEVLLGTRDDLSLSAADYASGLSFGCHVVPDRGYWLGGLSTSGGSIEWLRGILGQEQLTYQQLTDLLAQASADPTDLLYIPHLLGSSSSSLTRALADCRAAFIGLQVQHGPADLLKAVLQGTAYEMERIRRTAVQLTGAAIERVRVAGGGTRNPLWLQIKADVSNCVFAVSPFSEVTLVGAAMIAGIRAGLFADTDAAMTSLVPPPGDTFQPDARRHRQHQHLYEQGYLALQAPLNRYYSILEQVEDR